MESLVNNDSGIPPIIVRFFHNKITVFMDVFTRYYLRFWDFRFTLNLLSVVGCFGLVLGFWYLLNGNFGKKKYLWVILAFLLLIPLIEIMLEPNINIILRMIIVALPLQIFSVFGVWQFLKNDPRRFRVLFIICLLFVSAWWISILFNDISGYCVF